MNLNDKVHIDQSIILNVLEKSGVSLNTSDTERKIVNGEIVITRRCDIAGQILCEPVEDTHTIRPVQFGSRNAQFFIPQEVKEARVNWEVLFPRAHWPIYALSCVSSVGIEDFSLCLRSSLTQMALCKNTYRIIDVSDWDEVTAQEEYTRLLVEQNKVLMYGITKNAKLIRMDMDSGYPATKVLFICVY